ncbi:resolvase [Streptomyces sp. NPDC059697]|uniref:resolvase n=1 Tax=Streptomyces sp. NPDC059697 TaxID=3346912 RepID=UPI0036CA3110
MPEYTADVRDTRAPELPVTLDIPDKDTMPDKDADFLRATELEAAGQAALDRGVTVRRSHGYTLRLSTAPAVHRRLLARCQPLNGTPSTPAVPAQREARREYENRVNALTAIAAP